MSRLIRFLVIAIPLAVGFLALPVSAQDTDLSWMEDIALVELETADVASMHRARALIQSRGGKIAIMSPPSILMGWIPVDIRAELIQDAGIRDIFETEVMPGEVRMRDSQTRHMVDYFNGVKRGEYVKDIRERALVSSSRPNDWDRGDRHDVRDVDEPFDEASYLANLRANGFDVQQLKDRGVLIGPNLSPSGIQGNSDTMTGTATVTLLFVESDGSGADPNSHTWTSQTVQSYISGVNTGLLWWSQKSYQYSDCWVAFFVRYVEPTDSRCQNWREMVLHPSADVAGLASDIMANFGYNFGTHLTRVDAYNSAQRALYGTNWAYTAFIAYNPFPSPDQLTDGLSAFAYKPGPYTFLLYRSYTWGIHEVFTHETGHIFGACDEYASACACGQACSQFTPNLNCDTCPGSVACMMKANTFNLCSYTDEHLGWGLAPCAPTPLAPPAITSITPSSVVQGQSLTVKIAGTDFLYGAFVGMGAGITIQSTTAIAPDTLALVISVDNAAAAGTRDVTVTNRDLQMDTMFAGFSISTTNRHYASASGGNVFPYYSPATAANDIANAVAAAAGGDSILVLGGPISVSSITVDKPLTILGAWNGPFTARDPVSTPTTVTLSFNVELALGSSGSVFDGFVLQDGQGTIAAQPTPAHYGGGIQVFTSTVTIRNCEIFNCRGYSPSSYSAGGGLSGYGSNITLENVDIHDNAATVGGGIFLYNCTGTITDCVVEGNVVTTAVTEASGGGIEMQQCGSVVLSGVTIHNNNGSRHGGGMAVRNSGPIAIAGGTISYNNSGYDAGGVYLDGATVTFDGTGVVRNFGLFGGGIGSIGASSIVIKEARFEWNASALGGGVLTTGGTLAVTHSLFVGNIGGGIAASALTSGVIQGNTLDRSMGGGGGIHMTNSPIELFDNIIANASTYGIQCTGTAPTVLYNNVLNSGTADYLGCSAGPGSGSWDPAFVDTASADYHLGLHSGAIDAGRPGASYNDPDGSRGDMGWYGSHSFAMDQPAHVENLTYNGAGSVVLSWDPGAAGDVVKYAVYCDTLSGFKPSAANFVGFVSAPDTSINVGAPGDTAYYVVNAVDSSGYAGGYSNEVCVSPATSIARPGALANRLYQNVPNPFNPTTTIRFEIAGAGDVLLAVYDVRGRHVRTLLAGYLQAGRHSRVWDGLSDEGERVSSGVYFYKLRTAGFVKTKKMILLK